MFGQRVKMCNRVEIHCAYEVQYIARAYERDVMKKKIPEKLR